MTSFVSSFVYRFFNFLFLIFSFLLLVSGWTWCFFFYFFLSFSMGIGLLCCARVSFPLFIPGVPRVRVRSGVGLILLQNHRASLG